MNKKKVLILAAGGGFDIVTVQMLKAKLIKDNPNISVDIAGWLNPKFDHFIIGNNILFERSVNKNFIQIERYRRPVISYDTIYHDNYKWCKCNLEKKPIVEADLLKLNYNFYSFSTRYGLNEIIDVVIQYDEFIVCDVGGDILYFGELNNEVRTPHIDGLSVALLDKVSDKIETELLIIGLGTDNELNTVSIEENLKLLEAKNGLLGYLQLEEGDIIFLKNLYEKIEIKYAGSTIRRILNIWDYTHNDAILLPEMKRYEKWFNRIPIICSKKFCEISPYSACTNMSEINTILHNNGWSNIN